MAIIDAQTGSFTVPVTSGNYAPERIWICRADLGVRGFSIGRITADVSGAVATAVLEVWVCKPGSDPTLDASYILHSSIANGAVVGGASMDIGVPYAQLRAKSGGTAGTLAASMTAFSYRDP